MVAIRMGRRVVNDIQLADGVFTGPVRGGRNWSSDEAGSIHDDATASKLGFRGGTVAGSIHMDQFVPVLLHAFGDEWFRSGSLSLYFTNATTDGERVQVSCEQPRPPGAQVKTWMNRDDGTLVMAGTAGLGDVSASELRTRDLRACDPADLRMFREIGPGFSLGVHDVELGAAKQRGRMAEDLVSGAIGWYDGATPWGGPIASPSTLVELLWAAPASTLRPFAGPSVGLFGAIEVAHVHGPIVLDRPYRVSGEVVAVGQSPKTEYVWFDSAAQDGDGRTVATMRMLLRFMKASSPLYAAE
jgi:hypothetical protein